MSDRGERLYAEADRQIKALLEQLSGLSDPGRLSDPCAGREKLGDGSIAAVCSHVADIFERIAEFAVSGQSDVPGSQRHPPAVAIGLLSARLTGATESLDVLGRLDDALLDAVPQEGAFRFADGQRTLEQVLTGLLRHQNHQVEAIVRALSDHT